MNVVSLLTPKMQVVYLYEDYSVRRSLEVLKAHSYTAVPVLSRDGQYVGTVSEGDFLWNILDRWESSLRAQEKVYLREIIRPGFNPAVSVRVSMEELLEQAMDQSFVPVVDDRGAFMGIVTRRTILGKLTMPNAASGLEAAAYAIATMK